jgi:hypothetical protein
MRLQRVHAGESSAATAVRAVEDPEAVAVVPPHRRGLTIEDDRRRGSGAMRPGACVGGRPGDDEGDRCPEVHA